MSVPHAALAAEDFGGQRRRGPPGPNEPHEQLTTRVVKIGCERRGSERSGSADDGALRRRSLASIRQRNPGYSEAEIRRTFVRVVYQIDVPK